MNVYIRELARALGERGHSVDVYTRAHNPRDGQICQLGPNARLIHIKAGRVEDMGKLVQYRHLADFAGNLEDFRRSHQLQYDLIHSHYWLSGQVGRWLGELWQVPDIAMFHTCLLYTSPSPRRDRASSENREAAGQRLSPYHCRHRGGEARPDLLLSGPG